MAGICRHLIGRSGRVLSNHVYNNFCSGIAQQKAGYANMAFTFASPISVFYKDANVKQVDVPTLNGNLGILPQHVPLLAVLKPGVVAVHENEGATKKFFVSSGSVTINADSSVQILVEEGCPMEQLDVQAIKDGAAHAAQDLQSANTEKAKAEAQISVECFDALQKAVESHR